MLTSKCFIDSVTNQGVVITCSWCSTPVQNFHYDSNSNDPRVISLLDLAGKNFIFTENQKKNQVASVNHLHDVITWGDRPVKHTYVQKCRLFFMNKHHIQSGPLPEMDLSWRHESKETYDQTRGLSNLEMKHVGKLAIIGVLLKAVKTSCVRTMQGRRYLMKA